MNDKKTEEPLLPGPELELVRVEKTQEKPRSVAGQATSDYWPPLFPRRRTRTWN